MLGSWEKYICHKNVSEEKPPKILETEGNLNIVFKIKGMGTGSETSYDTISVFFRLLSQHFIRRSRKRYNVNHREKQRERERRRKRETRLLLATQRYVKIYRFNFTPAVHV